MSKKHSDPLSDSILGKPVTALPGIGPVSGAKLEEKGFKKVYNVLGKFLLLNKDEERFKKWLHYVCDADTKEQTDCCVFLREWCSQNL